ncbi:MAG TPA: GAP family protein [Thermoleophilaceae bacterium]|nr:GAP family protein [Thermoleophilaceae bacterium]
MGPLLAQVVPLAAGAAISPALLGVQVLNLSRPRSPLGWAWSVALGAALLLVAATVAALIFHLGTGGHKASPELKGVVKLVGAAVLFGVAIYELVWASGKPQKSRLPVREDTGQGAGVRWPMVGVGAGLLLPNLALYFPAAHEIAASGEGPAGRAAALVLVFAITMLPAAAPPLALMVLGNRVKAPLQALNDYVTEHRRGVTAIACVVFGAALLVSGLIQVV